MKKGLRFILLVVLAVAISGVLTSCIGTKTEYKKFVCRLDGRAIQSDTLVTEIYYGTATVVFLNDGERRGVMVDKKVYHPTPEGKTYQKGQIIVAKIHSFICVRKHSSMSDTELAKNIQDLIPSLE